MCALRIQDLNVEQTKKFLCLNDVDIGVAESLCNCGFNGRMLASFRYKDYFNFSSNYQVKMSSSIALDLMYIRDRFGRRLINNSKFVALLMHPHALTPK